MEHERHLAFGRDDEKLCISSLYTLNHTQEETLDEENEINFVFYNRLTGCYLLKGTF